MHSRIIQLTEKKLCSDEYIEERDFMGYEDSISNYIQGADYVIAVDDRKEDIEWFKDYLCDDLGLNLISRKEYKENENMAFSVSEYKKAR